MREFFGKISFAATQINTQFAFLRRDQARQIRQNHFLLVMPDYGFFAPGGAFLHNGQCALFENVLKSFAGGSLFAYYVVQGSNDRKPLSGTQNFKGWLQRYQSFALNGCVAVA